MELFAADGHDASGCERVTGKSGMRPGYRHLDYFADMIYLTVGDLDIPAQIPSELRTL